MLPSWKHSVVLVSSSLPDSLPQSLPATNRHCPLERSLLDLERCSSSTISTNWKKYPVEFPLSPTQSNHINDIHSWVLHTHLVPLPIAAWAQETSSLCINRSFTEAGAPLLRSLPALSSATQLGNTLNWSQNVQTLNFLWIIFGPSFYTSSLMHQEPRAMACQSISFSNHSGHSFCREPESNFSLCIA